MGDIFYELDTYIDQIIFFVQSIIEILHGYKATEKKVLYNVILEQTFNCIL